MFYAIYHSDIRDNPVLPDRRDEVADHVRKTLQKFIAMKAARKSVVPQPDQSAHWYYSI
jgi:hypothetical protein